MRRCLPKGKIGATRLTLMLGGSEEFGRIGKIYVTDTRRTQQTAAGLAQRLGLKPEIVDAKTDSAEVAQAVRCARIADTGRSSWDTATPSRKSSLRLRYMRNVPPMGDDEFDTMYVVTVPTIGKASVLRLKY